MPFSSKLLQMGAAGAGEKLYVEDVFSTYLVNGTTGSQTITNGIDLSGDGGLVWLKARNGIDSHYLIDSARGSSKYLLSNDTAAEGTNANFVSSLNADGFTLGTSGYASGTTAVSWTFRKAKKFFDVVTYTGNNTARTIAHNLGSTPGCIIIKCLDDTFDWIVWHRSFAATNYNAFLNTTNAAADYAVMSSTAPTSTVFSLLAEPYTNSNGKTYVAYLFAHNAGGFGLAGDQNVITCGSFVNTGGGGPATINLGWEPQWVLIKSSSGISNWRLLDNMRGWAGGTSGDTSNLFANTSGAESPTGLAYRLTSTGFVNSGGSDTNIYIAIRKGPMKTPTTGTSIFTPTAFSGNDTSGTRSAGLDAFDLLISKRTASSALDWVWLDKLRTLTGTTWLASNSTSAETVNGGTLDTINTINGQYTQNGINITKTSNYSYLDAGGSNYVWYALKRAPGFFDEVCYTGTGVNRTVSHNLSVAPELIIVKDRTNTNLWRCYSATLGATKYIDLNSNAGEAVGNTVWNDTAPTSSVFTVGTSSRTNDSAGTYVSYLFATCAGVSKVGSYTGTGALQTVNCGFTGGARFVMIKRTDSTGDWYVYDSAQGISSGNDPYLLMNSTAVQATGTNYVDTTSVGFQVTAAAPAALNANGGTYIFLAIA